MSHLPPDPPDQTFEISGDASLEEAQIGGQVERDLHTTHIQGSNNIVGNDNTVVRGNDNTVIKDNIFIEIHPGQRRGSGAELTQQEYRNYQTLLRKVKEFWVEGVLQKSLHQQILIALAMDDRPDSVAPALNRDLLLDEERISLPESTSVISVFDQIGIGRSLLILGEPGSGKTISLLQLTQDLIERAEQDASYLIPVVLNLSSWAAMPHESNSSKGRAQITPAQSIAQWIVEQLNSQYQVSRKLGQQWVDQQKLLLLLDGLDEVQTDRRNDCVVALNAFQQEQHTEMVVCCRIKDYEALHDRLNFDRAIYLQPLTLRQGLTYLDRLRIDLNGLKQLLIEDSNLQELAQTPLMLHLMVLAYEGIASDDLPQVQTRSQRQQQLFDRYIDRMFERSRQFAYVGRRSDVEVLPYSHEQTFQWLRWLAQQMIQESQTVFLIEVMQPSWLHTRIEGLSYRVANLVLSELILGLIFNLFFGFIGIPIGVLVGGLMFGQSKTIRPIERLCLSLHHVKRLLNPIGDDYIDALMGVITALLISQRLKVLNFEAFILTAVPVIILSATLNVADFRIKTLPNEGILSSGKNFLLVGLMFGLLCGVSFGLMLEFWFGLSLGLLFGLIYGLRYGGIACIQHFNLRLILYRKERIPWNYARFLDYAADRLFLQKVGGGYIFVHRLLMEHFAQLEEA